MKASNAMLILFTGMLTFVNCYELPTFHCSRYCKEESNNKLGYEAGSIYQYKYAGRVNSLVNVSKHTNNDESGVTVASIVSIERQSSCDYIMKLSETALDDFHTSKAKASGLARTNSRHKNADLIRAIEANDLHFSFHNGKIDIICPPQDETQGIVEIKKAILSAFQNNMLNLHTDTLVYESDITGNCETSYEVINANKNGDITIKKHKNLEACTHRVSQYLSWQSVPYKSRPSSRSLPLLRSTFGCIQKYNKDRILMSSDCDEKHIFEPFSNGDNGALTVIKQTFTFVRSFDSKRIHTYPNNPIRISLLPKMDSQVDYNVDGIEDATRILIDLERKTDDGVDGDVPKLFSELVYNFQKLNAVELLDMFNKISTKQRAFFIDAVSLLTTNAGIDVMKDLYTSQKVTKAQMNHFISFLTFTKKPSLEMIRSIRALLNLHAEIKQSAILAVSSIVHRFCKKNPKCLEDGTIEGVMMDIEAPLLNGCVPKSVQEHDDIMLSLKGIGNAGLGTSLNTLQTCYMNQNTPLELRLAAIASHRKFGCRENVNLEDFNTYFANQHENTEIRIASYLASMQCASYALFSQVKDVFMKEETNQVGSFVWTHLTNLQETSAQWKQGIRKLLENDFLRNKFNTDVRKYSRNYEASTFIDALGAGGSVETNVIFTSESYIPRSAMLNLTLDLFGESINVLEVGARIEGFEEIVENLFGPNGYFADSSLKALLENAKRSGDTNNEKIKEFGEQFRAQNNLKKDPGGLLYAKMFGNEFAYSNFKNLKELFGEPLTTNSLVDMLLDMLRKNDIDFKKSFMFLDSSYTIPTSLGLPLNLAVNGTATLGLTVKGKIDLKDVWTYKMVIEGKIYPSASVQIVGTMSVDSIFAKSGIKYESTMNSNSYIDGHAFINGGKIIDLQINVPKKQMDIINIQSNVFIISEAEDFKILDVSNNIENFESCTQKGFGTITGLEICYKMKYVNASDVTTAPYFPLTGGFQYALNLKKTDTFDSYVLQIKSQTPDRNNPTTSKPIYAMSLNLDTPNSRINRKITASYHVDCEQLSLNATILTPFASIQINSDVGNEFNKYAFQLQTLYNNKEIISVQSSFKVNQIGTLFKYEPLANFNYRTRRIAAISGSLSYLHGTKYSADLKLEGVSEEPIQIVGDVTYDASNVELRTSIASKGLSGKAHAGAQRTRDGYAVTATSTYSHAHAHAHTQPKQETLSFVFKINKARVSPSLHKDALMLKFESTQQPLYNAHIQMENQRGLWYFENMALVSIFATTWKSEQLFKLHQIDTYPNLGVLCYLKCEEKAIDYRMGASYNYSKSDINIHTLLQLNQIQRIEASFKYKRDAIKELIDLLVYYPKQTWTFNGSLIKGDVEDEMMKYHIDFHGAREADHLQQELISVTGHYFNFTVGGVQNHKISCSFDLPMSGNTRHNWATPWTISSHLQISKEMFLSVSQLHTQLEAYVLHINSMQDTFSTVIQANDERLLVINAAKTKESLIVLLGLNIYQHFELSANLLLPHEKFDLEFYWDKDRDKDKKFQVNLVKDGYKGLYTMDLEYPNQKITSAIVLLPTQVTMNVTWGIKVSQRIYLKVGNTIYDDGATWFGELETPFHYLEKQEFILKYYVLATSFEVQSDISWRQQEINCLISGFKTKDRLSGNFRLNTTMPEISKVGASMTHEHNITDNNYKTDANFIYNEHQITGQSNWKLSSQEVDSNFKIESLSNTIYPIVGSIHINNTKNVFSCFLNWQNKLISVLYSFKTDSSFINIITPFEGFEKTNLNYQVVATDDNVFLEVTVHLFKQFNNVKVNWINLNDSMHFWMDINSPVTGFYKVSFSHSTLLGILNESFKINGADNKEIILINVAGNIVPVLEMNVTASLLLLDKKASLYLKNKREPLSSNMRIVWNELFLESALIVRIDNAFNGVSLKLLSNVLAKDIELKYYHYDNEFITFINLPYGFELRNHMHVEHNYRLISNEFKIKTFNNSGHISYSHHLKTNSIEQSLETQLGEQLMKYNLIYIFNDKLRIVDQIKLNLELTEHAPFSIDFSMNHQVRNSFKPVFYAGNAQDFIRIDSTMQIDAKNSVIALTIHTKDKAPMEIELSYNFFEDMKTIEVLAKYEESFWRVFTDSKLNRDKGMISMTSEADGAHFKLFKGKLELEYLYKADEKIINLDVDLPEVKNNYNFNAFVKTDQNINTKVELSKNNGKKINGKDRLFVVNILITRIPGHEGYIIYEYLLPINDKKFIDLKYKLHQFDKNRFELSSDLNSNLDFIKKTNLNIHYNGEAGNQNLSIAYDTDQFKFLSKTAYAITKEFDRNLAANLSGNVHFLFHNLQTQTNHINLNLDLLGHIESNQIQSKLDVNIQSNIPKINNFEIDTQYTIANKGYEAYIYYKYETKWYRLNLHNANLNNFTEIYGKIETPIKLLDLTEIKITTTKTAQNHFSELTMNLNHYKYVGALNTTFRDMYNIDSTVTFLGILNGLKARFEIKNNATRSLCAFETFGDSANQIKLVLDKRTWLVVNLTAIIQSDYIELEEQLVEAHYDFLDSNKTVLIEFQTDDQRKYTLKGNVGPERIHFIIDKPGKSNFIKVIGTHKLENLSNFSMSVDIYADGHKIKLNVLNYANRHYQTQIDLVTSIRDWNRLTFESKMDDNVIRMSAYAKNQHMSLFAKKHSLFQGDDVFAIEYQGETLLVVWSGLGQTHLTTSTRYGMYRLLIQHSQNPGIYVFSILKNGENLISLILQNLSTPKYTHLKGKLMAPELIPKYANISLQFHADQDISKSLQFNIYNSANQLFEMRWMTRQEVGLYAGHFKFNSKINALPNIELQPDLNINQTTFKTKLKINQIEYKTHILLPIKSSDTKIELAYPCKEYTQCQFNLDAKPKSIEFFWATPFATWKNVTFNAILTDAKVNISLIKNNHFIDAIWTYQQTINRIGTQLQLHNNIARELYQIKLDRIELDAVYLFYKSLRIKYNIFEQDNSININVTNNATEKSLNIDVHADTNQFNLIGFIKGDLARVQIKSNEKELMNLYTNKIGHNHSQLLKLYVTMFGNYDLEGAYDLYDPKNQSVACAVHASNSPFHDDVSLRMTLEYASDLSKGQLHLDVDEETNAIDWSARVEPNAFEAAAAWRRQSATFAEVSVAHARSSDAIATEFTIVHERKRVHLLINGTAHGSKFEGFVNLKTPLDVIAQIEYHAILKRGDNAYEIFNQLEWPNSQKLVLKANAGLHLHKKWINTDFQSTFTKPLQMKLIYLIDANHEINFNLQLEQSVINLIGSVQNDCVSIKLLTPFKGYTIMDLDAVFDQHAKIARITFTKESDVNEFYGDFFNDQYKIELNLSDRNRNVSKLIFNVTKQSNDFKGVVQFYTDDITFKFGFDNSLYTLNVESPYEKAREIELNGSYGYANDLYSFQTEGIWNQIDVNISGTFKMSKDHVDVQLIADAGVGNVAQIIILYTNATDVQTLGFDAYFPTPRNNIQLKFDSNSILNETKIQLKTPFERFARLEMKSIYVPRKYISIDFNGNVLKRDFVSTNKGVSNATAIDVSVYLQVPDLTRLQIEASASKEAGAFHVDLKTQCDAQSTSVQSTGAQLTSAQSADAQLEGAQSASAYAQTAAAQSTDGCASSHTITFKYSLLEPNQFSSSFALHGNQYNASHSMVIAFKDTPSHIEYGITFDDYKMIETIDVINDQINTKLFAKIPYFAIDQMGLYLNKDQLNRDFKANLFYNNYHITTKIDATLDTFIATDANMSLPYFNVVQMNANLLRLIDGFDLTLNAHTDAHTFNTSTIFINNNNEFKILVIATHPSENVTINLYVSKSSDNIFFEVTNRILFNYVTSDAQAKLKIFFNDQHSIEHNFELISNNRVILIKLISPAIQQKDIEIHLNATKPKQFNYIYKQMGVQLYHGMATYASHKSSFSIKAELNQIDSKLFDLCVDVTKSNDVQGVIVFDLIGKRSSINFLIDFMLPCVLNLNIESPYIEHNQLVIQIEASSVQTMQIYICKGPKSAGNYLLYKSLHIENTYVIEIEAPNFENLKSFDLASNWDFDKSREYMTKNMLEIDSNLLGLISIQVDFTLLEFLLDIDVHLKVPFLIHFEKFDAKIYIPDNFRPKLEFVLANNVTYGLHFNHTINEELIGIDGGWIYEEHKCNLHLDVNVQERQMSTDLVLPIAYLNHLAIRINQRNDYMFAHSLQINQRRYSLKHGFVYKKEHKSLNLLLETPYINFNEYSLDIEYKNKPDKVLRIFVLYPQLKRKIGVNFALMYENFMSFKMNYMLSMPVQISGFDFGEIYILNELNVNKPEINLYVLESYAKTNDYALSLNIGGADTNDYKQLLLDAHMNDKRFYTFFRLLGASVDEMKLFFDLKTPLESIQNFNISYNTSTQFNAFAHSEQLIIIYNDYSIINADVEVEPQSVHFLVENVWKPVAFDYKYEKSNEIQALARIVWDLRKPNECQLGAHLTINDTISLGIFLPNNTIMINTEFRNNASDEFYFAQVSWNAREIAMKWSYANITRPNYLSINSEMSLTLPFRTFRVLERINATFDAIPGMNSSIQISWGLENASSLMVNNCVFPGQIETTITSPALAHALILTIDMAKFNEVPSIFKSQFVYTQDPNKLIQFDMMYNKNVGDRFWSERHFIIKHPASKIDYELHFKTIKSNTFSNGSVLLKYKNYESQQLEQMLASIQIDHGKFGVSGAVITNRNEFSLRAASTSDEASHGFAIATRINEKDPLHLECKYDFRQISPSVNLMASYGDRRKYELYAGLPTEREITAKLEHRLFGVDHLDGLITMRLNTSQLLWIKMRWKRELLPHFHRAILDEYDDFRFVIEATGRQLIDVIHDDVGKAFVSDVSDIKTKIISYANREKATFIEDLQYGSLWSCNYDICDSIRHFVSFLESNNRYYKLVKGSFQLIYNVFEAAATHFLASIQHAYHLVHAQCLKALEDIENIKNIKINAKDILRKGVSDVRKSLKQMETIAVQLLDNLDKYITKVSTNVEQFFEPFLNLLDDFVVYVEQRLGVLQIALLDVLDRVQHYIYNLRETKEMLLVYSSYINWLEELHVTDFLEPIGDVIEEILDRIITDVKQVMDDYKPYLDAMSEAIFGKYEGINQLPPVAEFREYVNKIYQKTIWIWNYHNMTDGLKSSVHRLSNDIDEVLTLFELDDKMGDFENPIGQMDYVFRPELGLIEISQPLPVDWDSFHKSPAFEEHPLYQKIQRKREQFLKLYKARYDWIDGIRSYLNDITDAPLAPKAHNFAMVIGKTHFLTFNQQYVHLLSNCTYLLASDFKSNSFSLLVNYTQNSASYQITTDHDTIILKGDNSVALNNQIVDLPINVNQFSVTKEAGHIIIESKKGFKMICNHYYDFCTFELSGWMFGRTGGILGTLDNEAITDKALPNGTRTNDDAQFIKGWELEESCNKRGQDVSENMARLSPVMSAFKGPLCNVFFDNDNSPLAECFDTINPSPFKSMCRAELSPSQDPTICASIAAYKTRCSKADVLLEMPEMCLKCDQDIGPRDEIFAGNNPKSVDVVFITEQDCHEASEANEALVSLPEQLNQELLNVGFTANRYASVGYGSTALPKPHLYSSNNHIWADANQLKITKSLTNFSRKQNKFKGIHAIKFASNLNFRAGISKLFILSQCEIATEMNKSPELYNMLADKDITLHIIKCKPFGNFGGKILGIDENNHVVPIKGSVATSTSNKEIIQEIQDMYSGLALTTNGTVFDLDGFQNASDAKSWARLVATKVRASPCQKCRCVSGEDGIGQLECTRCLSPTVKQLLSEYEAINTMNFGKSGETAITDAAT